MNFIDIGRGKAGIVKNRERKLVGAEKRDVNVDLPRRKDGLPEIYVTGTGQFDYAKLAGSLRKQVQDESDAIRQLLVITANNIVQIGLRLQFVRNPASRLLAMLKSLETLIHDLQPQERRRCAEQLAALVARIQNGDEGKRTPPR